MCQSINPAVCEPPCMTGACVATNVCNCPYGHKGTLCESISERIYIIIVLSYIYFIVEFECENNFCNNNGSCSTQIFTEYCTCVSPYTGQYCETGNSLASHPESYTINNEQ